MVNPINRKPETFYVGDRISQQNQNLLNRLLQTAIARHQNPGNYNYNFRQLSVFYCCFKLRSPITNQTENYNYNFRQLLPNISRFKLRLPITSQTGNYNYNFRQLFVFTDGDRYRLPKS